MKIRTKLLIALFFITTINMFAQHVMFPLPINETSIDQIIQQSQIYQRKLRWTRINRVGLDVSEVAFVNWSAGGSNSISGLGEVSLERNYLDQQIKWNNKFVSRIGLNSQEGREVRKTEDMLEFTSNFGYRSDTISNWYYSAKLSFQTQYFNGYKYPDVNSPISKFMAPGYLFLGVGAEYGKRIDNLSVYASPLTYKSTLVLDQELANNGSFGVEPAVYDDDGNLIKEGEKFRNELGILLSSIYKARVMDNIDLTNSINLYTDYLNSFGNIDIDWEVNFNFKVNTFVVAKLGSQLKYDNDVKLTEANAAGEQVDIGARTQWKQQLGIGVIVDF
ncbi:MAG: DUF3078 domain-containing protein [Leeuwenhoekiella sp.]